MKCLCSIHKGIFRWNKQLFFTNKGEIVRFFIFPERSPLIEALAVPNVVDFQSFVGFINLRDFDIVQLCIFSLWISLFDRGVCGKFGTKLLWFFYFSLWLVCHFQNPLWWACALHAVSGCARLEPGKTNLRSSSSIHSNVLVTIIILPSYFNESELFLWKTIQGLFKCFFQGLGWVFFNRLYSIISRIFLSTQALVNSTFQKKTIKIVGI